MWLALDRADGWVDIADWVSLAFTSLWPVLSWASLVRPLNEATVLKEPPGAAGGPIIRALSPARVSWQGCSWQPGLGSDSIIGVRVIKKPLLSPLVVIG